ncbi:hypothetical protein GIB67_031846 [Kingdonia uniflora]|uniref:Protein DA1-like domain-containing protein n=1 Tax=Kingdonia uniflora TaxID=39325 RepID=A0A7J7L4N9_9MAGN|nr:hypothetical protein GIB67_031846 [Kingdonia uniflora]
MAVNFEYFVVCGIGPEIRTLDGNRGFHGSNFMYMPSLLDQFLPNQSLYPPPQLPTGCERLEGFHHMSETRGLCLSEEQTVTSILRRPRIGGNRLIGMRTHPQKLTRKCEVIAILVLYGLPRLLTGSILAHELMHGWLRLKDYHNLSPEVEEGICQMLSYMWLESEVMPGSQGNSKGRAKRKQRVHEINQEELATSHQTPTKQIASSTINTKESEATENGDKQFQQISDAEDDRLSTFTRSIRMKLFQTKNCANTGNTNQNEETTENELAQEAINEDQTKEAKEIEEEAEEEELETKSSAYGK